MQLELTQDGDYMICALYKEYKAKRKSGNSKVDAKCMGSSEHIHSTMMSEWTFEDVDETCRELSRAGLLNNFYADNVACFVQLTDKAIIYMENRLANDILDILDYMDKIKKAIFF